MTNTMTPRRGPRPAPSKTPIPDWKWQGTMIIVYLTGLINGFDVSNVANIQPHLYEAFGHIEVLPWIGLSYSLANFAALPIARRIIYCFDMYYVYIVGIAVFLAGTAVAGSSENMSSLIAGRIVMGIGGCICQHCATVYIAIFSTHQSLVPGAVLYSILSGVWAVGLVIGGPIGSAFAVNSDATWRWAFYVSMPWLGLAFLLAPFFVPRKILKLPDQAWSGHLMDADVVGICLQIVATVLFAIALTFSGPVWAWKSAPVACVWAALGVTLLFWAMQQYKGWWATSRCRTFPIEVLADRNVLLIWIPSACAGATYAVILYYTPLFFAFTRGLGSMQQTVRILPFVLSFIVTVIATGVCVSKFPRYSLVYLAGGAITFAGGLALTQTLSPTVSEAQVMCLTVLTGIGLGMHFQHGTAISDNRFLMNENLDRAENIWTFNIGLMGGVANSLTIASAIYENYGFHRLESSLRAYDYSSKDIREALAGVVSAIRESPEFDIRSIGRDATSDAIAAVLYLSVSGGAICFLCAMWMEWDLRSDRGDGADEEVSSDAKFPYIRPSQPVS